MVANDAGSITSTAATLTVSSPAGSTPVITTEPISQTITAGNSVTFTVAASGTGTLAYQWYFNGTALSGATNPTFSIATVATTDAGSYYCAVANTVGSVNSTAATLTVSVVSVGTTPTITTQPVRHQFGRQRDQLGGDAHGRGGGPGGYDHRGRRRGL